MPVVNPQGPQLLHTHRDPDPGEPTLVQVSAGATHGLPRQHSIQLPKNLNQGKMGICVVEAFLLVLKYEAGRYGFDPGPLSALFLYWNARKKRGTEGDPMAGTDFGTILSVYEEFGACAEADWPQSDDKVQAEPPAGCYEAAARLKLPLRYARLPEIDGPTRAHELLRLMRWLIHNGHPIMIGVSVTHPIMSGLSAPDGRVPLPTPGDPEIGGHGLLLGEYDDPAGVFGGPNSWGFEQGLDGDFFMGYRHATLPAPLARDRWVLQLDRPDVVPPEGQLLIASPAA